MSTLVCSDPGFLKLDSIIVLLTLDFFCVINISVLESHYDLFEISSLEGSIVKISVWEQFDKEDSSYKCCLATFHFVVTKEILRFAIKNGSYPERIVSIPVNRKVFINRHLILSNVFCSVESNFTFGVIVDCEYKCVASSLKI